MQLIKLKVLITNAKSLVGIETPQNIPGASAPTDGTLFLRPLSLHGGTIQAAHRPVAPGSDSLNLFRAVTSGLRPAFDGVTNQDQEAAMSTPNKPTTPVTAKVIPFSLGRRTLSAAITKPSGITHPYTATSNDNLVSAGFDTIEQIERLINKLPIHYAKSLVAPITSTKAAMARDFLETNK